ncbi:hypothetical protein ABZU86_19760 [Streptomyces sp. NPDC005271]|uniref:hypothetical protein n=1 Tax=unclassified Streptomyces TaxID=2593676 RepID=UPI0033AD40AE
MSTNQIPVPDADQDVGATDAVFTALLEDSVEELYERAPCGYLSTTRPAGSRVRTSFARNVGALRKD